VINLPKKLAVVGAGGWGVNHVRVASTLKALGYINDVVVMDIDENRARYVSKIYGAKYTTSFEDILRDDEIDYVIVATPTPLHYNQAKKILEAGKNVLVEKPMTENSRQALDLVDEARRNNRLLMTGFLLRYSPAVEYMKNNYVTNRVTLGDVLLIYSKRVNPWPIRKGDVGVIRDLAIHDIDLTMYIFDSTPSKVYASGKKFNAPYEVISVVHVDYDSKYGTYSLLVEASWITPYKFRRLEITATKAIIFLDLINHTIEIYSDTGISKPKIARKEPLFEQDKNFVLASQGKENPKVTGVDGYRALLVCDMALEAMEKGKILEIPQFEV